MTKAKLYFAEGNPEEIFNLDSQNFLVSGISTLGITTATNLTSQNLLVSGISTLGSTSVTNLTSQNLSVSGISTLGVTTTTNLTSRNILVSGITTIGLTTTSPPLGNSQLTFELISNTNLRIRVRGTDGVLRFANILLST